ncbi:MAG: glycosyltransferase, partial [Dehalococcoidia bacterium]
TTDVPGCRDAIVPGETGLLVAARDAEGLAAAMQRLMGEPVLRQRFGRAGRKLAERDYDVQVIARAHLQQYRGLVPPRSQTHLG